MSFICFCDWSLAARNPYSVTLAIPVEAALPRLPFGNMHQIIVVILAFHDLPTNEQVLEQISPKDGTS